MSDPILGTFHDAITGQTIIRELTPEESLDLPEELGPSHSYAPPVKAE